MNVLMVEDETRIAEVLKKNLLNEGHYAIIVPDGEAALKLLKEI